MVFASGTQLRQSIDSFAKGFVEGLGLIFLFALTGCASGPSQPSNVAPSIQSAQTGSGLRLTSIGVNRGGRLSPDGKRILFLSKDRAQHKNWQLYELNLENFREKRITYHDGDCVEADYSPQGNKILYASTTDEIKERPVLVSPSGVSPLPATELYLSDLKGTDIERLTRRPGYEGQFSWVGAKQFLYNVENNQRLEIHSYVLGRGVPSVWQSDTKASLEMPTVDSSGTRTAWVIARLDADPDLGLKIKGKISSLKIPFQSIQSMQWISGIQKIPLLLMSARKKDEKYLSAWILDPERKCIASVFREPGDVKDLRTGQTQEKLLFTFQSGENSQLFLREFPPLPTDCEPLKVEAPQTSDPAKSAADPQEHPKTP